jgi:hypothetical protein
MILFRIKNEFLTHEAPDAAALVSHLNSTAKFKAETPEEYMKEYARRAVIARNIDIRATDFTSFLEDLQKHGDIIIISQ